MVEFFEEVLTAFVPLLFIFLGLFVLKFILSNIIALFAPVYEITLSPDKTTVKSLKTGQVASIDNYFYTAFVPDKKSGLHEVVVAIGTVDNKPERELEQELKQHYKEYKKNTFENFQDRIAEFWQIILFYFLFGVFKANIVTLMCGKHRIYFQGIGAVQLPATKKAIKSIFRNARFIESSVHGISQ